MGKKQPTTPQRVQLVPPGRGGGFLGNRISCLKTPLEQNVKKGGVWGGFKGVFRCAGVLSAEGHPPPPMKYIVSGTSEQLGMQPRCDPTIRTAPTTVYGRVSSPWVFPAVGIKNLGTVGTGLPREWYTTCLCSFSPWATQKSKFSKSVFLIL